MCRHELQYIICIELPIRDISLWMLVDISYANPYANFTSPFGEIRIR